MEMWYPGAKIKKGQKSQGKYPMGHPQGAIVHFTAGRRSYKGRADYETGEQAMENSIAEKQYGYFVIGMNGTVWQSLPINLWGYHAGKAYHSRLNTTDVSMRCVGIEICNAGLLENGVSWFKERFPEEQIRTLKPGEYQNCKNGGQFLKYTLQQEEALEDLLLWLNTNSKDFSLENVYGHDEVAPSRKNDPGGALSVSMPAYREYLLRKAQ
jgi:N-acetyl-anhydromuramyl-L-alanine amidase AmpD